MHVVPDVMRAAVPHVFPNFFIRVELSNGLQLLIAVFPGGQIHRGHGHARLDDGKPVLRGVVGALIQRGLLLGKPAVAGPSAGYIVDLVVPPGAHVVQDHVAVLGLAGVAVIVDAKIVLAR